LSFSVPKMDAKYSRVLRVHVQILEQHRLREGGLVVDSRAPVAVAAGAYLEVERAVHPVDWNVEWNSVNLLAPGKYVCHATPLTCPFPCQKWMPSTRPCWRLCCLVAAAKMCNFAARLPLRRVRTAIRCGACVFSAYFQLFSDAARRKAASGRVLHGVASLESRVATKIDV